MNGYESSVLAFLSQRPEMFSKFEESLRESKDRLVYPVAMCLAGVKPKESFSLETVITAESILEWARKMQERIEKLR